MRLSLEEMWFCQGFYHVYCGKDGTIFGGDVRIIQGDVVLSGFFTSFLAYPLLYID